MGFCILTFFYLLIFNDFMRIYHIQYNDAFGFAVCAIPADYSQQFVFPVHTTFLFVSIHQQSFNTHIYKLDITFIYIQIHIKMKNHKNLLNIYSTLHTTTLLIIYI